MKINNNSIILGNEQDNLEYKYRKEWIINYHFNILQDKK